MVEQSESIFPRSLDAVKNTFESSFYDQFRRYKEKKQDWLATNKKQQTHTKNDISQDKSCLIDRAKQIQYILSVFRPIY